MVVGLLDGCGERLAARPGSSCRTLRRGAVRGRRSWTPPAGRGPTAGYAGRPPRRDTTGSPPSWSFRRRPSCCRWRPRSSCPLRGAGVLEGAPTGRSRVAAQESLPVRRRPVRAGARDAGGSARPAARDRKQGAWRARRRAPNARPHSSSRSSWTCASLKSPSTRCSFFRARQDALEIGCVVEGRRDVDQVAQLLGVDAHLVETRRRGVLVDGSGAAAIRRLRRQARRETTSARRRPALRASGSDGAGRSRNVFHSESSRR